MAGLFKIEKLKMELESAKKEVLGVTEKLLQTQSHKVDIE